MHKFRSFLMLVDGLMAVFLSVVLLLWRLGGLHVNHFSLAVQEVKKLGLWGLIPLLALTNFVIISNLLYALIKLFSHYDSHIRVKIPDGEISVTVSCLEDALQRAIKSLPEVHNAWLNVFKEKGKLDRPIRLQINFAIWEDANGKEAAVKIKEVCKYSLSHIIDLSQEPRFKINLIRIVSREEAYALSTKTGKKTKEEVPDSLSEFRGPVYPVDEETP